MGMFSVICENKEKYQNFLLKMFNFYNLGKICISHGHVFVICENKDAVTAKLISACVFAALLVIKSISKRDFKLLALCGCSAWFMSDFAQIVGFLTRRLIWYHILLDTFIHTDF